MSLFEEFDIETTEMPQNNIRLSRKVAKREFRKIEQTKNAIEHLLPLPQPDESIHMVTNARFDFYDFIPAILQIENSSIKKLVLATWIINKSNIDNMFKLFDSGEIKEIGLLTGIYFKRRESSNYTFLAEGMIERKQKFRAALSHAKFFSLELENGKHYTIESSANMTENGNVETHVLSSSKELHNFHCNWINTTLTK